MDLINTAFALIAAVVTLPIVAVAAIVVWLQDRRSPFYMPMRVGLGGRLFRLFKLRTMIVDADKSAVDTTVAGDPRITTIGRILRRFKIDELPQFWNVLVGDMALVGPRPNVRRETDIFTILEKRMLTIKPGITDIASIVFSDLGDLLSNAADPNISYNQLIRPWKSRLALFYVDNRSLRMDLTILALTGLALMSRRKALMRVAALLSRYEAPAELINVALREQPLVPVPPPGASSIVVSRE